MKGTVDTIALTLEERIRRSITLGESHFREFKSALEGREGRKRRRSVRSICKDIAEVLVSFSNADGGELIVGVEDDGAISGILHDEDNIKKMMNAYKTHIHKDTPIPTPRIATLYIDAKKILYLSVEKGIKYYFLTSDGRCLQRSDRDNLPISVENIELDRQEQRSKEYDRVFVDGATTLDLNEDILKKLVDQISPGISPEKCLQYLGLAEYSEGSIRIRRAAILLAAENYTRWYPKNEVRILKISGTELQTGSKYNVVTDELVKGNIIMLLENSWEVLRPHLVGTRLSDEGVFIERILYPEGAVREALINAIAHRDYSIEGQGIEIKIYDDRMEIQSPGTLLSSINIEDLRGLKGVHESRNVYVTRCLRELGYMRELGEGMRRIYSLFKQYDLVPPNIIVNRDKFVITLYHKSIFSPSDQIWLDSYENFDLSREERLVLILGRTGRLISPQEIIDVVDIIDTEDYRALVYKLQLKGVLYSIMSGGRASYVAKKRRKSRRKLPRYKIRDVNVCRREFVVLLRSLMKLGEVKYYSRDEIIKLKRILPRNNLYDKEWTWILNSLKEFNLINDKNEPTQKLKILTGADLQLVNSVVDEVQEEYTLTEKEIAKDSEDLILPELPEIFLAGIPVDMTSEEVRNLISPMGKIRRLEIPRNYTTAGNRGYAFILMDDIKSAKKVKNTLSGYKHRDNLLRTDWAHGKKSRRK